MTIHLMAPDAAHVNCVKRALPLIHGSAPAEVWSEAGVPKAATVEVGFHHRVAWLAHPPLVSGAGWSGCVVFSGWRSLVVAEGRVISAITSWTAPKTGARDWKSHWGSWGSRTADAVQLAEELEGSMNGDVEPVLLRVRSVGAAALWLRPFAAEMTAEEGVLIPLPNAPAPRADLYPTTCALYLARTRVILARRARRSEAAETGTRT